MCRQLRLSCVCWRKALQIIWKNVKEYLPFEKEQNESLTLIHREKPGAPAEQPSWAQPATRRGVWQRGIPLRIVRPVRGLPHERVSMEVGTSEESE
jgi:hypothetical protein